MGNIAVRLTDSILLAYYRAKCVARGLWEMETSPMTLLFESLEEAKQELEAKKLVRKANQKIKVN